MNYSIVRYILCKVILFSAAFLALPCIIALIYKEPEGWYYFFVAIACLIVGLVGGKVKYKSKRFYAKEGFITVSLSWIVLSIIGALPFFLSGEIPNFIDALFENISGFTTTGASILSDVEALSYTALMWRSFTHWLGGMGVLVLILAILPLAGGSNMYLMRAESPGPTVGKLVPRVRRTAMILYGIYLGITLIEVIALLISGMSLYEAVNLSFATAGTGGFGIVNTSIGSYTALVQNVITVFMFLFGVNFSFFYFLIFQKPKNAFAMEEVRWYFGIYAGVVALIVWNARDCFTSLGNAIHHVTFTVASIMTTTGFSTVDFTTWPQFSQTLLVAIMFVGACAGSTGGGIKVSRIVVMLKSIKNEIMFMVHPRRVKQVRFDGHAVSKETTKAIKVFLIAYVAIYLLSVLLLSFNNFDFTTNFTAVAATINNIGPGLSMVGPTHNFGDFSGFSKIVLMFDMLAGRLEIFPMLVLLTPAAWKS